MDADFVFEPEQINLLKQLVTAMRGLPREQRQPFIVARTLGGDSLIHPAFKDLSPSVYLGDLEMLARRGLLHESRGSRGSPIFQVTPEGFQYYDKLLSHTDNVHLCNSLNSVGVNQPSVTADSGSILHTDRQRQGRSNRIFVVHGHDNEMKEHMARTVTDLGLVPIILHEQPNRGRTIIEKFLAYSDVGFAVVLLSPDDIGRRRDALKDMERPRARQNVVLELGFFIGKLGRENVMALRRSVEDFEVPSDYDGMIYEPYDVEGHWKFRLAGELKSAGYDVDANKLL